MKPACHITLWLVAVIVTVAAALMPSGARAHGSHGQGPAAQTTDIGSGITASGVVRPSPVAAATERVVSAVALAKVAGISRLACACPACTAGTGCGHAPTSCCATGLAPSPIPSVIPPLAGDRAPARDGPYLVGVLPEAQIEPPRPFA